MQFKNINEQLDIFISILEKNTELMDMLDYISKLNLPNFYIASGSIYQTIWNYYDNKNLNYGINDIDVIYFNKDDLCIEKDLEYYNMINEYAREKKYNYKIDVSNEARMHLWEMEHNPGIKVNQYKNSEDAISNWIATVHAVGITKENGEIKVYAPCGLSDIFSKTIRTLKHNNNYKELYNRKIENLKNRFDNLNIIEW